MVILGIESTCDETAAAVVKDGSEVLSNIVSSQIKEHSPWSGVVPEIASRLHLEKVIPVVDEALKSASVKLDDIELVAASNRPGLIGGLLVGTSAGKSIAWMNNKPFLGINHMEAHLFSPHLDIPADQIKFPYIGLLISGGHTMIVLAESFTKFKVLGTTIDDAAGEAFDKVAKFYEMGYPGGPAVEKMALNGDPLAFDFPISNLYKSKRLYDVSYSGIKTAVIHHLEKYRKKDSYTKEDIAASFQKRAFDVLIKKTRLAADNNKIKNIVVAGGVSANKYLRASFNALDGYNIFFPALKYATDNGAMIAGFAYHKFLESGADSLDVGVSSRVSGYKISLERSF